MRLYLDERSRTVARPLRCTSLNNIDYIGSGSADTDKIWLKAYDGIWTNWVGANITNSAANASLPANANVSTDDLATSRKLNNGYAGNVTSVADSGTPQLDNFSSFTGTVAGLSGQAPSNFVISASLQTLSTSHQANTGNAAGSFPCVTAFVQQISRCWATILQLPF